MGKEFVMDLLEKASPYLAVVFLQFGYAGSAIIAKTALNYGMSHYTFSVYRNLFAAVTFTPFAVVLERKIRPKMTLSVMWKIMLLALLEPVIDQNLYYEAMKYTTATYATAMTNMLPAITFLFAWILKLEQVDLNKLPCQVKILGTILTVGGAMIMTLVTGGTIAFPWTRDDDHVHVAHQSPSARAHPIEGALMITAGCMCWATFYILQAITLKSYPAGLSLTSMICMAGALQNTVITLVAERKNPSIWSIGWNPILLSYVYSVRKLYHNTRGIYYQGKTPTTPLDFCKSRFCMIGWCGARVGGILTSGIGYYISGSIMKRKGPVFVTSFNPLNMVIVAMLGSFLLREKLTYGRAFGALVIVVGLYLIIWGKSRDHKISSSSDNSNCDQTAVDQQESSEIHMATASSPNLDNLIKDKNVGGHNNV